MTGTSPPSPLLHLITGLEWRAALHAGAVTPPSLLTDGFVHLSRPDQVALPVNRLFAGRSDVLLLVLDPDRLGAEVRWEPGVPTDPESMRFPHLYGPLPVAAVTSVVPYRPGSEGRFAEPAGLPAPDDPVARALAFDRSLVERRAAVLLPVTGGVAVLDPRVFRSHEHNALWLDASAGAAVDAATIAAEADRVLPLAGCDHRRVVSDRPLPADLGWEGQENRVLVLDASVTLPGEAAAPVVAVTASVMAGLWDRTWRRDIPGISDEAVEHLIRREDIADAHLSVTHLAVLGDDGVPVSAAQLRVDGATAAIEEVITDAGARGRGFATAVVVEGIRRARAGGCDVVFLVADADDWPRHWYERLGFVDVGARWEATRS